jgi:hypothetical protein
MDCTRSIRINIKFSDIFKFKLKPMDNVTEIRFINSVHKTCGHANKLTPPFDFTSCAFVTRMHQIIDYYLVGKLFVYGRVR